MEFRNIEPPYLFISQVKASFRIENVDLAAHQQPYTVHLTRHHEHILELPDGEPDGLSPTLGLDDLLLELVEPLAGFEHSAYYLVSAYKDAACGVGDGITHVNADALEETVEVGATEKHWEPHLEFRTPRDHYGVTAFRDGE